MTVVKAKGYDRAARNETTVFTYPMNTEEYFAKTHASARWAAEMWCCVRREQFSAEEEQRLAVFITNEYDDLIEIFEEFIEANPNAEGVIELRKTLRGIINDRLAGTKVKPKKEK